MSVMLSHSSAVRQGHDYGHQFCLSFMIWVWADAEAQWLSAGPPRSAACLQRDPEMRTQRPVNAATTRTTQAPPTWLTGILSPQNPPFNVLFHHAILQWHHDVDAMLLGTGGREVSSRDQESCRDTHGRVSEGVCYYHEDSQIMRGCAQA